MRLEAQAPPSAAPHPARQGLERTLGPWALTFLGIGCIIGTGIFVLTGTAAARNAGPAVVLSFLLAGAGCGIAALCYAEFATSLPSSSGSSYSYAYAAFGRQIAWFVGWNLVLEYMFATSTIAVGWSAYVVNLCAQFGLQLPASLTTAPLMKSTTAFGMQASGAIVNVPAMAVIAVFTLVCCAGIRASSLVNGAIVVLKVGIIVVFVAAGVAYVDPSNWRPFVPANAGSFGEFGWSGVMRAAAIVFYTFIGFDSVATAAREARNPSRTLPLGILGSLAVCAVLYVLVAAVLTGLVPYRLLDVPAPVALALDTHEQLWWLRGLIKIGALSGMTSAIVVTLIAQPRIFLAMATDRLLPDCLGAIHPRRRTPVRATLITGAVSAIIAGTFPIQILGELVAIGTLTAFLVVCAGIPVLRRRQPDLPRPFRVPFTTLTCTLGALTCALMMLSLPLSTWIRLVAWSFVGACLFLGYGRSRGRLT